MPLRVPVHARQGGRHAEDAGSDEVEAILAERGDIEVRCEYCNQAYRFDVVDSVALFHATPSAASRTDH